MSRAVTTSSDGFNSRLEPIAYDIYRLLGGCRLEERKFTWQSLLITIEFQVVIFRSWAKVSFFKLWSRKLGIS